jgi:PAS domain S-box-containing protein
VFEPLRDRLLEAMPTRAALLDGEGRVVAANRAWLQPEPLGTPPCDDTDAPALAPIGGAYLSEFFQREAERAPRVLAVGSEATRVERQVEGIRAFVTGVVDVLERRRDRFEAEVARIGPRGRCWFSVHVSALAGDDALALVTEADVSSHRRAQEALSASEGRLRTIVTGAPIVIFATDGDGLLSLFDGRGAASLGVTPERVSGRSVFEVFAHVPQLLAAVRRAMSGEASVTNAPIGSMTFELRCSPSLTQDHRIAGVVGIATDITERARIERLKNEFVSIVSHELRTPLTSIRGSLGLLDGGIAGVLPGRAQDLVKIALTNSERLIRLVNDILDLDKIEMGRLELRSDSLEPAELADHAIAEIAAFAESSGVTLLREFSRTAELRGDRDRLLQVLINLLSNAIKFSKPGDAVRLVIEQRVDAVRFTIADEGPGIAEDQMPKLFRKFSQLDESDTRATGGSGLGLAISKAIVDAHGGSIGVTSKPGAGARFHFEIPCELDEIPRPRPRAESSPLIRLRRARGERPRVGRDDDVLELIDRARAIVLAPRVDRMALRDLQRRADELARRRGLAVALRSGLLRVATALQGLEGDVGEHPTSTSINQSGAGSTEQRRALAEALAALEGEAGARPEGSFQ